MKCWIRRAVSRSEIFFHCPHRVMTTNQAKGLEGVIPIQLISKNTQIVAQLQQSIIIPIPILLGKSVAFEVKESRHLYVTPKLLLVLGQPYGQSESFQYCLDVNHRLQYIGRDYHR